MIALHVLIVYGLVDEHGHRELPKFGTPIEAMFIPEQTEEPEPEIKVKPEIEDVVPLDEPVPEVQFDEPIAPPAEVADAGVRECDRCGCSHRRACAGSQDQQSRRADLSAGLASRG